jgi:tetratricopeptide (TPR) repeat protein
MNFRLHSPLSRYLHIIFLSFFISRAGFSQPVQSSIFNNDQMWNRILNCEYPANPVTHATIKFSKGKCSAKLSDSNNKIEFTFADKTPVGALTKDSIPGMAVCMNVDSGNGIKYSYVVAFLQRKNSVIPEAYVYLGKNIAIKEFEISAGSISVCWVWQRTEDDTIQIDHMTCRNFSLINNSLVDEDYEYAVDEKLKIANDTIYIHSVKTGMWDVKWNTNRADAYNNTTGDTIPIYCNSKEDVDDNNKYNGDIDLTYFKSGWYYNTDYQMLSIVGPYVSFLSTYDGSGGAHPIYGNVLCVSELGRVEASEPQDTSTAPYDTTEKFEKMIRATKNLRETDKSHAKITDIFQEKDVFNALMKDSIILAHLPKFKPKNLKELSDSLDGECEMDFSYLLESFAIRSIRHDTAVILFGLTHGCEVEKGNFTIIEIELPIPNISKKMFEEAAKNKTTIEDINPAFLVEQDSTKLAKQIALFRQKQYEDSVEVAEQRKKASVKYYEEGSKLFDNHQYSEAIVQLTKALELYPDDIDALRKRYISCANVGNWKQVLKDCNEAIKIDSVQSLPHYYRALCYARNKEFAKAVNDYNQVDLYEITVPHSIFHLLRGTAFLEIKKYKEALQDLNQAVNEDTTNSEAYLVRGDLYLYLNNFSAALHDYQEYRKREKDSPGLLDNMGYAYSGLKNYDEAISYFNKSITANSSGVDPILGMAIAYYLKGNSSQAIRCLDDAIRIYPNLEKGMEGISELERQGYSYNDEDKRYLKELFAIREKTKNGAIKK